MSEHKLVECTKHGASRYSFICKHLLVSTDETYFMMSQTHEDPAQAWCNDCQTVLDQERGWSDRADETADWKLVCSLCFTTQLNRNNLEAIFED